MRPPILLLADPDSPNRFAGYLEEMLRMEGIAWLEVTRDLESDQALPPLVMVTAMYLPDDVAERLAAYVRGGGALLSARPAANLTRALGLPPARLLPEEWSSRYVLLDPGSEMVAGLPWAEGGVQFMGRPTALLPDAGEDAYTAPGVVAWIAPFPGQRSRFPAVTAHQIGAGRVVLFAFDPAESAVRQQQGRPEQSSTGALPDFDGDTTYRPSDLFLGQLDPALKDVPQADVQRTLLLRAVEWLTESQPLPRLWRFPANAPAAAFFDGDSDAMDLEDFHNALSICDRYDAPFATYLKPEAVELVDASAEAAARARGHRFGPHPWAGPQPTVEELRGALEANCAVFAARYGYRPRIHRGHWLVWPGWVDHARSLQGVGIEMDANYTAGWGFKGGYVNGTGLPARFVDEDGKSLDVYEQSTISTDDGWLLPKGGLPAHTLAQAISRSYDMIDAAVERYHTVYHPYFHPRPLKGGGAIPYPTRPWLDSILAHCRLRGIPYLDAERWLDWNIARRGVTLTTLHQTESGVECSLHAAKAIDELTVLLPLPLNSTAVAVAGSGGGGNHIVRRHGRLYASTVVSLRAGEELVVSLATVST